MVTLKIHVSAECWRRGQLNISKVDLKQKRLQKCDNPNDNNKFNDDCICSSKTKKRKN